jgi:hypothetical protein
MTVGQSPPHTPVENMPNTYADVRIPVRAGDILGYFSVTADDITNSGRMSQPGFETRFASGSVEPGSTTDYIPSTAGNQLNISATLELDCDNDGFGDETQDESLDAPVCPPGPRTTITSGPKDKVKTRKKRAKATFSFAADEQGATFECTLDGQQQFKTCTSPLTVSVKKGEHTLSVTATDPGGNAGTAATDSFKVKRKKKK